MASPPKRVYWDACAWIAVIQKEKIQKNGAIEDREMMGKTVIEAAKKGKVQIFTSAFCLAEVCRNKDLRDKSSDKIADYFENDYILIVALDKFVGERARNLMLSGYSKLKPPDASHVATALLTNVDEMHTFDDKLIELNGLLDRADGRKLVICKPSTSDPSPLFGSNVFQS